MPAVKSIVLFISHSAGRTGAPNLLLEIARRLDPDRFIPVSILPEEGPLTNSFRAVGKTFIVPLYPRGIKYLREAIFILQRIALLRSLRPDVVYCNTIHSAKWLVYAKLLNIPTITHVHELSMGFAALDPPEHYFVRRFSTKFIAVSDAVKCYLRDHQRIPSASIAVVRAGIDPRLFGRAHDSNNLQSRLGTGGCVVVGTVGRITAMKGSDLFLRVAASLLGKSALPLKFLVVASTADQAFYRLFRNLIDDLHLQDHIIIVEEAENPAPYYSLMDIYLSTAREDPFPLVVLEAMASELPVVAFAAGGVPEAVTAECALLVADGNVDSMTRETLTLINDSSLRTRMGRAGRRRVERDFDVSKNIDNIQTIIDSLARRLVVGNDNRR